MTCPPPQKKTTTDDNVVVQSLNHIPWLDLFIFSSQKKEKKLKNCRKSIKIDY